jgi:hypothetical protein
VPLSADELIGLIRSLAPPESIRPAGHGVHLLMNTARPSAIQSTRIICRARWGIDAAHPVDIAADSAVVLPDNLSSLSDAGVKVADVEKSRLVAGHLSNTVYSDPRPHLRVSREIARFGRRGFKVTTLIASPVAKMLRAKAFA